MNRPYQLLPLLLLLLLPFAGIAQDDDPGRAVRLGSRIASGAIEIGDYHLLAIGIDNYLNPQVSKLKTAVHGARALRDLLIKEYTFEPRNCKMLLDGEATTKGIMAELRRLAKELGKDDALLIYYAGHGNLDDLTKTGYWIPVDGDPADPTSLLPNTEIKKILGAAAARDVLLISDSCFAGDFFRGSRNLRIDLTDAVIKRGLQLSSRLAMTSGGVEPVSDGGGDGHSIYTYFLLKALAEASGEVVLSETLHDRIKGGVRANAQQDPRWGLLHGTKGETDGRFVFLRRGTASLDAALERKRRELGQLAQLEANEKAAEADKQLAEMAQQRVEYLEAVVDDMTHTIEELTAGQANADADTTPTLMPTNRASTTKLAFPNHL